MSAPAPAPARVRAQAAFEVRTLLSNGEQLLVSLVLPLLVLLALVLAPVPTPTGGPWADLDRVDLAAPGVLALAVVSTAFTGQAILLAYERRYGVLRLLGTTPLGRSGLLLAKALAVVVVVALQALLLAGAAAALGWAPHARGIPLAVLVLLCGTAFFVALAALVGGTLRAEAVLAVANLVWVVVLALGGVVLPADLLPDPFGAVVSWLPPALLGDALRVTLSGVADGTPTVVRLLALTGWTVLVALPASRLLRWSD